MVRYEAGAHAAQMNMLRVMLLASSSKFADLGRATGMSNDHANFHLQQLVKNGYVRKVPRTHGGSVADGGIDFAGDDRGNSDGHY